MDLKCFGLAWKNSFHFVWLLGRLTIKLIGTENVFNSESNRTLAIPTQPYNPDSTKLTSPPQTAKEHAETDKFFVSMHKKLQNTYPLILFITWYNTWFIIGQINHKQNKNCSYIPSPHLHLLQVNLQKDHLNNQKYKNFFWKALFIFLKREGKVNERTNYYLLEFRVWNDIYNVYLNFSFSKLNSRFVCF